MNTEARRWGLILLFNLEFSTSSSCIVTADIMHFESLKRAAWHKIKRSSILIVTSFSFAFNSNQYIKHRASTALFSITRRIGSSAWELSEKEKMPLQQAMQSLLNESDEMRVGS